MRRLTLLLVAVAFVLVGCIEDDPSLGVTTTATGSGVRAYIDNCPAATAVRVRTGETVVWEVDRPAPAREEFSEFDVLIGETPPGWREIVLLVEPLQPETRYILATDPEGDLLDFTLEELVPGRLLTEDGDELATPLRIDRPCPEETAGAGEFARDLAVLFLLGICVASALAIIAILILHLVNRVLRRPSV